MFRSLPGDPSTEWVVVTVLISYVLGVGLSALLIAFAVEYMIVAWEIRRARAKKEAESRTGDPAPSRSS